MHSNLWAVLYVTLVPSGILLLLFLLLRLTNGKFYRVLLYTALFLLFFPMAFLVQTFTEVSKQMKLREGKYVVTRQENVDMLCGSTRFDSLTLTLDKEGRFSFNYKPCFADKTGGHWDWEDNMVGSFTTFEQISDSLSLYYPIDRISDTLILKSDKTTYLLFTKKGRGGIQRGGRSRD